MNAFTIRGIVCTAALLPLAVPCPIHAQGPTPATSSAVAGLVAERMLVEERLAGAGGTLADGKTQAAASVLGVSTVSLKSALGRLSSIRPGTTRAFLSRQLQFPRVRRAYETRAKDVSSLFMDVGIASPEVFFRVFKREQVLEVWARHRGGGSYQLLESYPVCKVSGRLGPKRRQGDLQIPEGFYSIDLLNPQSQYHLSMRVDYPNPVDRARGGTGTALGGDIYIHGGCATIGCVPVTDQWIEEIYLIAIAARDAGQATIPVHIFPTRLDANGMRWLAGTYGTGFVDFAFWQNLREGYQVFETAREVPDVGYDGARYTFSAPPVAPVRAPAIAATPGA